MKQKPTGPQPARHPVVPGLFRRALNLLFLALSFGLLAPAAQAAIKVTLPTATAAGSIVITQDITYTLTNSGHVRGIALDEWVTSDGVQHQIPGISPGLSYSRNGGLAASANWDGFYDNAGQAADSDGVTASDGYFYLASNIAVTLNDLFTLKAGTYTLPAGSLPAGFNPMAAQTFTGDTFLITSQGYRLSSNVPAQTVSGGWFDEGRFYIGTTGTASDTNNWPANESPNKAADGDANTKFLLFKGENAGLIITPPEGPATYNRLALTTANDGPERDPASYKIYGSTTALPTSGNFLTSGLTLIQEGELALTNVRNNGTTVAGPAITQFNNTTAYASYLVVFPTVKSSPNLTQIAEVKLSQGLTVPHQVAVGRAFGGRWNGDYPEQGSIRQSGDTAHNNWPAGESPDHALDGDTSTKYLHFSGPDAALAIRPEGGASVINSMSFWTANDAPERDPASYEVYGFGIGGWIYLGGGSLTLPATRNSGPVTVNFSNTTAYQDYAAVFPAVKNNPATVLTQISEVAFASVPTNARPTDITLSATSIPENNALGATIGMLTATDPDAGQTLTFSFGGGSLESLDNAAFTIVGNTLRLNDTADFETKSSYPVTIRATDNGSPSQYLDKTFTITITDVTIPQTIDFAPLADKTFGDPAFTVSATGGASGQPVTFSLVGADPGLFRIQGNTVSMNGAGTVTVRASQAGSGDYSAATPVDRTFTVAKAPQTITSFNPATTARTTDTVTLSATGGGSGLPVTFDIANDGPGSIAGNTLTFTGPGTVIVQASQAGNANYLPAADVDRTITVSDPLPPLAVIDPTSAAITATTATLAGNVTGDAAQVDERGVVFSLTSVNADPVIGGAGVTSVSTTGTSGVFTVPVTGLLPNRSYSFKAYAQKGVRSTTYSPVATFTTLAAAETITIGGTTVLSAANIGTNVTVPELLTGQTVITGTVNMAGSEDRINFTLPPGKAVISGTLAVSDYVAAVPPPVSGITIIDDKLRYSSASALNTRVDIRTDASVDVTAPTRCNTNTFTVSLVAPLIVKQLFIQGPMGFPVPGGTASAFGSASYVLTLEIGDQQTDSALSNLAGLNSTTLSPAFAPAATLYAATIPFAQTYVELTRTFGPLQYVTQSVNGGTASPISSGDGSVFNMNVGLNTIVYRVCAQNGAETTYTVNITREPDPNAPPTFSGYAFTAEPNVWTEVAKSKVLARAADADGGTLSIIAASNPSAQGNTVFLDSDNIRFAPANASFRGLDTFTVTISDGQGGSIVGTVTVNVADPGQAQNQAQLSILPGGNVALLFQGIPGQDYEIQRSTDLQNWSGIHTAPAAPDGTLPFTDSAPPPGAAFYRTALPNG